MKQKLIATIFLFVLLSAGCKTGDPIIGSWKPIASGQELRGADTQYLEFLPNGRYVMNIWGGTWRRLDDSRLEMKNDPLGFDKGSTQIVIVKIEGNVLTITESDGTVAKFRH